ncbi:hypothetical protein EXU85_07785 [Spirosoma sp. KCTC 42546]|uniref:DUF5990 family protein n=1 Tax=Spirosoma sp. KCTC 42546 TaxID=2520506 RepID=UPI00115A4F33|nr:DUF5990 family protein [Spirosoma sp. KCTC 42546]QDK78514.1 hypothetical protein EXU85_07785 [Spirosoma sp. KCTC 42546]
MDQELPLRIILKNPPAGVDFGLQKGSGNHYETVQIQQFDSQDLEFDFTVRVKGNQDKDPQPTILGPFVQGPPSARFVYLDIGRCAGQMASVWSRRLKVPLAGITWELVNQLSIQEGQVLETQVPGTGKDTGPNCGTVKPFMGWQTI